jgi:RNA polymerase sigma-70 factor (ECF subfamily)
MTVHYAGGALALRLGPPGPLLFLARLWRATVLGMDESVRIAPADEGALVARLRQGDGRAFEELVRGYTPPMLAVCRRLLRNHEQDAQDAVQDAFVSVFRSIASFEGDARLSTWLHRIAVNAALMKLRSRKRRPERPIEDLLPKFSEDGHHVEPPAPWDDRADVRAEREETRAFVREAIDRLPENYRVVLLLRDIDELETEQVAEILSITPNAVKIRVHRAHQALRTLLDGRFREAHR